MSLLDLGNLAEGLQKGLLNYQQQQDRKRQIQNEAQDRANKNLEFKASLKKQGLLPDDSGNLQYDPIEQTKRTVDAYDGMDKLAKSGYFPKYDEKGLLSGFSEDPNKFKEYQNARKNPLEEELTRARINELNSQSTKNLRDNLAANDGSDIVEGFVKTGNVKIGKQEEQKAREMQMSFNEFQQRMNSLKDAIDRNGLTSIPGEKKKELSSAYTDAGMSAKNAFKLGALSKDDYRLIEAALVDPTSLSVNAPKLFGGLDKKQVKDLLDKSIERARQSYTSQLAAYGLTPKKPNGLLGNSDVVSGIQKPEIKVIGNKQYKKVPGGWVEVE